MTCGLHLIWMISCVYLISTSTQQETWFVYNGFPLEVGLALDGDAKINYNGLLQLTSTSGLKKGHVFFEQPFELNSSESLVFSTQFIFAMVHEKGAVGGHGIAFFISPSIHFNLTSPPQYLGLVNNSTNGSPSSHMLAIELDTVLNKEFNDINDNHVGIDLNSLESLESAPASYFTGGKNKSIRLASGDPFQVWVDYDGTVLNVSLAPFKIQKPDQPLLSRAINLSKIFLDKIFVGFSGATIDSSQYILGWSFNRSLGHLQGLNISKLPQLPPFLQYGTFKSFVLAIAFIVPLTIVMTIIVATLVGAYLYRRSKYAEVREPWEKDYGPNRFSYKSLYKATKGFNKDERLGKGGFGEVFRGTLSLGKQIAVKRVAHDAEEGMKQFVAEIVSMGNLKHRNLVPLLGYCRRKGELLLVSEYMPRGSLDHYLFDDGGEKPVLSWPQRLFIIKDIASALDYLHREADQVVLHRDIKSSNVMLDAEFNGRLGDFGMARFHDHGANLRTTDAVGTIGYMAPELTTTGASTKTDVYGFGAFMLEVTCGRRPVEPQMPAEKRFLVKWVYECWKKVSLIEAKDPRLGDEFLSQEEVEMVLKLGLLCTNLVPESRPSMEQVAQYLNGNLPLLDFSPETPGIGVFSWVVVRANTSAAFSSSYSHSGNNSMFVSHSILYGHGR